MELGHHPHGGQVPGAVPGRAHAEGLAQGGQLPGGGQAADLADVHPDVVDQPPGDQLLPLQGVVEQLSHGQGHRHLAAELLEPLHLLRGQGDGLDGPVEPGLQPAVEEVPGVGPLPPGGGDIHQAPPHLVPHHVPGRGLHHQDVVFKIQVEQQVEDLRGHVQQVFKPRDPRVVHQQVQAAQGFHALFQQLHPGAGPL